MLWLFLSDTACPPFVKLEAYDDSSERSEEQNGNTYIIERIPFSAISARHLMEFTTAQSAEMEKDWKKDVTPLRCFLKT